MSIGIKDGNKWEGDYALSYKYQLKTMSLGESKFHVGYSITYGVGGVTGDSKLGLFMIGNTNTLLFTEDHYLKNLLNLE